MSYIRIRNWRHPIVTTNVQWLIRFAWGKRRISSRAAPGTRAYPESIEASLGLWLVWIRRNWRSNQVSIVVSHDGAQYGDLYAAEQAEREATEAHEAYKASMTATVVEQLQQERLAARAAKNFARADELRAQIEAAGILVADQKLTTL